LLWSRPRNNDGSKSRPASFRAGRLSVIARDLQITGALRSDGEIQVDGIVNGDITAPSITIGQTGTVIGRLVAAEIRICGTVHGELDGDHITLARTARVYAQLRHAGLSIEDGAVLERQVPNDPAADI
jgi:cytoskeletal protein CcmA (bactofilin family)